MFSHAIVMVIGVSSDLIKLSSVFESVVLSSTMPL